MDDHSSDDSAAILSAYARTERRIRLLKNPGYGLVSALNHGLSKVRTFTVENTGSADLILPGLPWAETRKPNEAWQTEGGGNGP